MKNTLETPQVSVIVPNYNHAPYLKQRIDSILNQTYQNFELIILDDYSTDNSREVIEQFRNHPKISQIVYNTENSGSTFKQWYKGIDLARGEYIWIAESDDYCENTFLEKIINVLEVNERASLCFTNSYVVDECNRIKGIYNEDFDLYKEDFVYKGDDLIKEYSQIQNFIPNASAVIFKKEPFTKVNKRDLMDYKINGDWFLWINVLMNRDCAFLHEPLNYFRRHEGAGSPKNILNFKNIEEAIKINIFLRKMGFPINYRHRLYIRSWVHQAHYSLENILKTNFLPTYLSAVKFYRFPVFSYIVYLLLKKLLRLH